MIAIAASILFLAFMAALIYVDSKAREDPVARALVAVHAVVFYALAIAAILCEIFF